MGTHKESGRCTSVETKRQAGAGTVPDAHDPQRRHAPIMLTTDLALRFDPIYETNFKTIL